MKYLSYYVTAQMHLQHQLHVTSVMLVEFDSSFLLCAEQFFKFMKLLSSYLKTFSKIHFNLDSLEKCPLCVKTYAPIFTFKFLSLYYTYIIFKKEKIFNLEKKRNDALSLLTSTKRTKILPCEDQW